MSTVKSSADHLTLNADGAGKDIKFQANGVEKASISSTGAFTSTSIDATKLSGALPAIDGSALTGISGGKVLQVVEQEQSTEIAWSDGSTQEVWSLSITTGGNSRVKISGVLPMYVDTCTGTWCNMAFLTLHQDGAEIYELEHEGMSGNASATARNTPYLYITDTLTAGTYTFSMKVNPYLSGVTFKAFRGIDFSGQTILEEIGV